MIYILRRFVMKQNYSLIHSLPEFNLPLIGAFTWLMPPGPYRATIYREGDLTVYHIHTFLTTQAHEEPPWMRDQLNAGATSETTRTWKTTHTNQAPIHSNKANMKGCLWLPNNIRGPCGLKSSWYLSYRWGKPQKNSPRKLVPDQTRTSCVTGEHATACSTEVDRDNVRDLILKPDLYFYYKIKYVL